MSAALAMALVGGNTVSMIPDYFETPHSAQYRRPPRRTPYEIKHSGREWSDFAHKVMSTHRFKPDGSWNEDPRHDKYLHSHARAFRGLRKALAA